MGTKTTKTKSAAANKRAAKTKATAEKPVKPAPSRTEPSEVVRKSKVAVKRTTRPSYSQEDIALRAYFIAERRQAADLPGDSHQDWIEAERQLAVEASTGGKAKAAKN